MIPQAKCNMNCAYCLSGHEVPRETESIELNEEAVLKVIGKSKLDKISIWGGEPFYNFERFDEAVKFSKKHFPNALVFTVTNGSLLTNEIVDYLISNDIHLAISHDGPAQYIRGNDFLKDEEYLKLIRRLEGRFSFNSVVHKYNCDLEKIHDYFFDLQTKLGIQLAWNFELYELMGDSGIPYLLDNEECFQTFGNSLNALLTKMLEGSNLAISSLYPSMDYIAKTYDGYVSGDDVRCGANTRLTIDFEGTQYYCQVSAERNIPLSQSLIEPKNMACNLCSVNKYCRSICVQTSSDYRARLCPMYKIFFTAIVGFLLEMQQKG